MATALDKTQIHNDGALAGLTARVAKLWETFQEEREIARQVAELQRFSDRELADLSIARGDIPRLVREGARG